MNDWLDAALKARPVVDDGFADRVIAIGRSQARNRTILRAFAGVLVLGLVLTGGARLFEWAAPRGGFEDAHEATLWRDRERAAFRTAITRLGALPVLARRDGKDASVVLDPLERSLLTSPCGNWLLEHRLDTDDIDGPDLQDCDTSAITGLAEYDVWRRLRANGEPDAVMAMARLGRLHLRRAAAAGGGDAYVAAARDVEGLGRLMLSAVPAGVVVFRALVEVTRDVNDAGGDTGGYVAPLSVADARLAAAVWATAIRFNAVDASDDDAGVVAADRSVLSCGARSGWWSSADVRRAFFDTARPLLDDAGCAPRPELGVWLLFEDTPTAWARARGALLMLPGVRALSRKYLASSLPTVSVLEALKPHKRDR